MDTTSATLTGEEIAIARTAIRVIRSVTAVGVAVAIPLGLVLVLPLLSYALLAGIIVAPVLVGVVLYRSGRQDAAQAV